MALNLAWNRLYRIYSIQESIIIRWRVRNLSSIFAEEQSIILACFSQLSHSPPILHYVIITLHSPTFNLFKPPIFLQPPTQRIDITLQIFVSIRSSCNFVWIPDHIVAPIVTGSTGRSKKSHQFKISDHTSPPANDLKNHYRRQIEIAWIHDLINLRPMKRKPTPSIFFHRNSHHEEIILTRLRISRTRLNHSYLLQNFHSLPFRGEGIVLR